MALYIQHGHGKSDKITTAFDNETAAGVIIGAKNEKLDNLNAFITQLDGHENEVLFDPQFYICTLSPPKDGYLPDDYSAYYTAKRTADDFIGAKAMNRYAKTTLDLQVNLGVSRLISPSVRFDSFSDRWCQIALTLADASIEYHNKLKKP